MGSKVAEAVIDDLYQTTVIKKRGRGRPPKSAASKTNVMTTPKQPPTAEPSGAQTGKKERDIAAQTASKLHFLCLL